MAEKITAQAFDLPGDYIHIINKLNDKQVGTLIKNVFKYLDEEPLLEMDLLTEIAFIGLKIYLDDGHVYYGLTEKCVENPNSDRQTTAYRRFRKSVLERDGYKCKHCGSTDSLHVHHIKSYMKYPKERLNVDNAITLCGSCHNKEHRR